MHARLRSRVPHNCLAPPLRRCYTFALGEVFQLGSPSVPRPPLAQLKLYCTDKSLVNSLTYGTCAPFHTRRLNYAAVQLSQFFVVHVANHLQKCLCTLLCNGKSVLFKSELGLLSADLDPRAMPVESRCHRASGPLRLATGSYLEATTGSHVVAHSKRTQSITPFECTCERPAVALPSQLSQGRCKLRLSAAFPMFARLQRRVL